MIPFISIPIFLIYINAPVVLVTEHGMPRLFAYLVPLLLLVPVVYRVGMRGESLRFPSLILMAFAMIACQLFSALISENPQRGLETVFTWLIEGVLLAFLLINALRTRSEVFLAVKTVVAAGALMGFLVLLQQAVGPKELSLAGFGQFEGDDPDRVQYRLAGPIGEVNRFAQILAVLIPVAIGLAITAPANRRWLYWVAGLLMLGGVSLTFSRGAMVSLALAIPIALLFGLIKVRHLLIAGVLGVVLLMAIPQLSVRVASIGAVAVQALGVTPGGFRNADGASRGRVTEMQATGLMFMDYPLFGAGPGMAPEYYPKYAAQVGGKVRAGNRRSHNLYLQLAAETGVIGLVTFLAALWFALYPVDQARRRAKPSDRELWALVCGLELGLIILFATSMFLHAAYVRYFWMLLALAVAAAGLPCRQLVAQALPPVVPSALGARLGRPV